MNVDFLVGVLVLFFDLMGGNEVSLEELQAVKLLYAQKRLDILKSRN